jgi:hypothetical protein
MMLQPEFSEKLNRRLFSSDGLTRAEKRHFRWASQGGSNVSSLPGKVLHRQFCDVLQDLHTWVASLAAFSQLRLCRQLLCNRKPNSRQKPTIHIAPLLEIDRSEVLFLNTKPIPKISRKYPSDTFSTGCNVWPLESSTSECIKVLAIKRHRLTLYRKLVTSGIAERSSFICPRLSNRVNRDSDPKKPLSQTSTSFYESLRHLHT